MTGMTKRAGQRDIPLLDITLATPLEGVESLKGTGAFYSKRHHIAYKVSFLDGGCESVKVRGAGGRGNRCSFFIKYEDPSQWCDEGESGDAFIRAFTEKAEAQARDTFATIVSKAKRARSPSIGAEDDDAPDAKRTRSSSVVSRRRKRRRAGGGTRSQVPHPSRAPPRRTHFGSSQTPTSHRRAFRFVAQRNQRRRGLVSFIPSGF